MNEITVNITQLKQPQISVEISKPLPMIVTEGILGGSGGVGVPGPKGDKGDKGDSGLQGIKGDKGDSGDAGAVGAKGDTGSQGLQGIQGIQGIQGEKGDTGAQGIKGIQGETGTAGAKGDRGDTGSQGVQGEKGETGTAGAKGDTGAQGIKGDKGDAPIAVLGVPSVGAAGQFLRKNAAVADGYSWATKDALVYNCVTNVTMTSDKILPWDNVIVNQGGITALGGGRFRLMNNKAYMIKASVSSSFSTANDIITYYIYVNGTPIGMPSVQYPVNVAVALSYSTMVSAFVTTDASGTFEIDFRCNALTGVIVATGYTNFIEITEV